MNEDSLSAADELRQAVHELARKTTEMDLSKEQLRTAAEHVRIAASELTGESSLRWGEATTRSDSQKSRTYRHRSLFQGELHPFSPTLRWGDYAGPDGELGCQFETILSSCPDCSLMPLLYAPWGGCTRPLHTASTGSL